MLSIIVPAYHEPYLGKTIKSLLKNTQGEIEVIPVLDGWLPDEALPKDKRVKPVSISQNKGKRSAINTAIKECKGKYVMLLDAHCIVGLGYDKLLTEDMQDDWLVVPRRYSLHPDKWERDETRPIVDYHYLSFPEYGSWGLGMYARPWDGMTLKRKDKKEYKIDDVTTIQASCWLAERKYFMENVYPLDTRSEAYGPLAQDQQELALKYWLGGGSVKVNKMTWYAHVSKRWYHYSQKVFSRRHKKDAQYLKGNKWGTLHWIRNEEPVMKYKFSWYVKRFWPVPEWPDDWEEKLKKIV